MAPFLVVLTMDLPLSKEFEAVVAAVSNNLENVARCNCDAILAVSNSG